MPGPTVPEGKPIDPSLNPRGSDVPWAFSSGVGWGQQCPGPQASSVMVSDLVSGQEWSVPLGRISESQRKGLRRSLNFPPEHAASCSETHTGDCALEGMGLAAGESQEERLQVGHRASWVLCMCGNHSQFLGSWAFMSARS